MTPTTSSSSNPTRAPSTATSAALPPRPSAAAEEDNTCPICFDPYSNKYTLECGHSACRQCFDQIISTGIERPVDENGLFSSCRYLVNLHRPCLTYAPGVSVCACTNLWARCPLCRTTFSERDLRRLGVPVVLNARTNLIDALLNARAAPAPSIAAVPAARNNNPAAIAGPDRPAQLVPPLPNVRYVPEEAHAVDVEEGRRPGGRAVAPPPDPIPVPRPNNAGRASAPGAPPGPPDDDFDDNDPNLPVGNRDLRRLNLDRYNTNIYDYVDHVPAGLFRRFFAALGIVNLNQVVIRQTTMPRNLVYELAGAMAGCTNPNDEEYLALATARTQEMLQNLSVTPEEYAHIANHLPFIVFYYFRHSIRLRYRAHAVDNNVFGMARRDAIAPYADSNLYLNRVMFGVFVASSILVAGFTIRYFVPARFFTRDFYVSKMPRIFRRAFTRHHWLSVRAVSALNRLDVSSVELPVY